MAEGGKVETEGERERGGREEEREEMRQEVKERQLQAPNQCNNTIIVLPCLNFFEFIMF